MAKKRATGYEAEVHLLIESAQDLENGPAKVAVLEEAVARADAAGDADLGFEARMDLVEAATFSGAPDTAMVAYAWCLAHADKDPDAHDWYQLLWRYKWVVENAAEYSHIGRKQIAAMLKDMAKRYKKFGVGAHAVLQITRSVMENFNDLDGAKKYQALVLKTPDDFLSNCDACEADAQVEYYLEIGRAKKALAASKVIFSGQMTCAEVPHRTHARVLLSLLAAGELELAATHHRAGYRLIGRNPNFLWAAARHIEFLALTGNYAAALKALERHLPNTFAVTTALSRMQIFRAAAVLLDRLIDAGKPAKFRAPDFVPKGLDPKALRDWFLAEAGAIAAAFDARNGNDGNAKKLAAWKKLKKKAVEYPIGK